MTLINLIFLFAAGAGTGVLGALLGTGGGVFLIPILVVGLDVPMHHAVATSILTVIATSSAVASANVERGLANMRLGMTLEIATASGAIAGGLTAAWLAPETLETLFAVSLVPTAVLMWNSSYRAPMGTQPAAPRTGNSGSPPASAAALGGHYYDAALGREINYDVERLWAGLGVSFVAGNLSGLLGIGGGVFKVPALHLLCGVPIKAAAATSNFMIGVTAAASAFLYYGHGEVQLQLTAAVVLGVLAGSAVGFWLSRFVGGKWIKRLFAVLLLAVAAQMFVRAWWS
ncbi:MAG: sulfite exporter TauE/SafE family protein [Pirellulales bacterium]